MKLLSILLDAQASQMIPNLVMIGLIIVVFYFFMIRPQQKKAKEQKLFSESIKRGDKVVTIGGLHGKIVSSEGDKTVIEIDNGVNVTVSKSAISLESSNAFYPTAKQ